MPRDGELSLNEREFLLQLLQEGVRADDRPLDAYRQVQLCFGDDYGAVDVRLGKTRVLARISSTIVAPLPDRPTEGTFQIVAEFSPVAAGAVFDGGTASQSEAEATLSRQLDKSVRRSRAVDTESLCIAAGRACVAVRADLQILRHDGNVLDATCLALAAALAHFRRPDAVVEQASDDGGSRAVGKVRTFDAQEREPVPLALLHRPLCVSFAACDGGDCLLLDPTAAEEQLREAEIVVAVNDQGELCDVTKYGGVAMDETVILECVALAHRRARELGELVARGLKQDSRKRDVGDLIAELRAENDR